MGADLMNNNNTATNTPTKINEEQLSYILDLIENFIDERGD